MSFYFLLQPHFFNMCVWHDFKSCLTFWAQNFTRQVFNFWPHQIASNLKNFILTCISDYFTKILCQRTLCYNFSSLTCPFWVFKFSHNYPFTPSNLFDSTASKNFGIVLEENMSTFLGGSSFWHFSSTWKFFENLKYKHFLYSQRWSHKKYQKTIKLSHFEFFSKKWHIERSSKNRFLTVFLCCCIYMSFFRKNFKMRYIYGFLICFDAITSTNIKNVYTLHVLKRYTIAQLRVPPEPKNMPFFTLWLSLWINLAFSEKRQSKSFENHIYDQNTTNLNFWTFPWARASKNISILNFGNSPSFLTAVEGQLFSIGAHPIFCEHQNLCSLDVNFGVCI